MRALRGERSVGHFARCLLLAGALCPVAGCATVAPYERERLAPRSMSFDPDALGAEMDQHVHEYREGAAGGYGGGGGGCGCN